MRPLLMSALLLVLSAGASHANDSASELKLRPAADMGPKATPAKGPAGEPAIEVTGGATLTTTTLIICENPAISSSDYVVRGRVKYDGVVGDGYLELWSDFGDKGRYFTRSLADSGPMKKLSGTSDWRSFELPFHATSGMKPQELTLDVVLPGAGKVFLTLPVTVAPLDVASQWWTELYAGLIGGGLAALLGVLGGLIGLSMAWGKSRTLTVSLCGTALAISAVSLIAGIVALGVGLPWRVSFPLLLVGVIGVGAIGFSLRTIVRRFQDDELRRMTAVDAV
jgi:hypothetical protein